MFWLSIALLIMIALCVFFIVTFGEMLISEKKGYLFILRPSDHTCDKIKERIAELDMNGNEFIMLAIEHELGGERNVRCRKD